jgi:hypothetical protein
MWEGEKQNKNPTTETNREYNNAKFLSGKKERNEKSKMTNLNIVFFARTNHSFRGGNRHQTFARPFFQRWSFSSSFFVSLFFNKSLHVLTPLSLSCLVTVPHRSPVARC